MTIIKFIDTDDHKKLASFLDKNRDARQEQEKRDFSIIVNAIFSKYPDLDMIIYRGYTPEFNDGDPCTHSSYIVTQIEELDESEHSKIIKYKKYINEITKVEKTYLKIFNDFADYLNREHGTNFTLTFTRKADSFKISRDDYDCGC